MRRPLCIHGCPRSSTTYHARALQRAGFNVGHNLMDLDGTVTHWLALPGPYPPAPWDMGTKAKPNLLAAHVGDEQFSYSFETELHIVRHPLKVIGSIRGGLVPKNHWRWFAEHVPECKPNAPLLERGMWMWLRYNEAIEKLVPAEDRYRVDDQGDAVWARCMAQLFPRGTMPPPTLKKTYNRQGGYLAPKATTWAEVEAYDGHLCDAVRTLAQSYGYDIEDD